MSTTGTKLRQLETPSPGLPNYLLPLYFILEEVDEIEITLDDDMLATGFLPSSPNVTLSSDFDALVYEKVDRMGVSYKYFLTVATTRVINNLPPSWDL